MDSINGISYYLNKCQNAIKHITDDIFFLSGRQRIGAHALCVQHSPTAVVLSDRVAWSVGLSVSLLSFNESCKNS